MLEINYNPIEILNLAGRLDPVWIQLGLVDGMSRALDYLQKVVQGKTPIDRGYARGNTFTEMSGSTVELEGKVFNRLGYVTVLEEGRRAGAKAPPGWEISQWLERHGIDASWSFVVARSIARRGLPAHHMFRKSAEENAKEVEEIIYDAIVELLP